jgi:hypothetical protein
MELIKGRAFERWSPPTSRLRSASTVNGPGSAQAPGRKEQDAARRVDQGAAVRDAGWITNKEAKQLFPSMADDYAFGEETGKSNIADFAAHVTPRCSFEFMPVEGRVYFIRTADGGDPG